jgi:hypothetical protein
MTPQIPLKSLFGRRLLSHQSPDARVVVQKPQLGSIDSDYPKSNMIGDIG